MAAFYETSHFVLRNEFMEINYTSALNQYTVCGAQKTPNGTEKLILCASVLRYFSSFCKNLRAFHWIIFISMRHTKPHMTCRMERIRLQSVERYHNNNLSSLNIRWMWDFFSNFNHIGPIKNVFVFEKDEKKNVRIGTL